MPLQPDEASLSDDSVRISPRLSIAVQSVEQDDPAATGIALSALLLHLTQVQP